MDASTRHLLADIENYCRRHGIAESTFGRRAINDGKLCSRLRNGRSVTLATAERVRTFMGDDADPAAAGQDAVHGAATPQPAPVVHAPIGDRPFRFYDNRQKYLAFVTTCNEKWKVSERAARELAHIHPEPPALRLFDAGVGDGTVLSHVLRAMHRRYTTLPFYVVGKEISLEDIRLALEKLPDRFVEHPATVVVLTNLHYREAPWLMPGNVADAAALNWRELQLDGTSAYRFGQQLGELDDYLVDAWQTSSSSKTGNPLYVRPSVLILYRRDHRFLLDSVIPKMGKAGADYDLVIASQPWRARMDASFKARNILVPLSRSLRSGGRLLVVQSYGRDPGLEIVQSIWPEEDPFQVNRHHLLKALKEMLGGETAEYHFNAYADSKAIIRYQMHTLPDEIAASIGTSTLFAAWNAAIYVAQIEDHKLESALATPEYLDVTAGVLQKHNGLWFNDEIFVVSRKQK